jgi:uncharacterized protein involved in type VI secretion and phage assembly
MEPSAYQRKPFRVQAIQVTDDNLTELAEWCGGEVRLEEDGFDAFKSYVDVPIAKPAGRYRLQRVRAYVGDWLVRLTEDNVFKIYKTRSFLEIFEEVLTDVDEYKAVLEMLQEAFSIDTEQSNESPDDLADEYTQKIINLIREGK